MMETLETAANLGVPAQQLAAQSTKSAWQAVWWRDFFTLPVNRDTTQITWTYNGASVLSGSTEGGWWWASTGWNLGAHNITQGFFSGAFRGQTAANFTNSFFCSGVTVYTFYFYNRVWGHANGTATVAQSSDSLNECLPRHVDVWTGYGEVI